MATLYITRNSIDRKPEKRIVASTAGHHRSRQDLDAGQGRPLQTLGYSRPPSWFVSGAGASANYSGSPNSSWPAQPWIRQARSGEPTRGDLVLVIAETRRVVSSAVTPSRGSSALQTAPARLSGAMGQRRDGSPLRTTPEPARQVRQGCAMAPHGSLTLRRTAARG